MGTTLSTFMLLTGAIVTGVLSALSANNAREKKLSTSKLWSGISAAVAAALVVFTLFIVVKGHTGAGEITGVIEEFAFGVMLSFIFMMLAMIAIASLNILALYEASKNDEHKTLGYSVGAAILSFGSFVVSLILIIFLL